MKPLRYLIALLLCLLHAGFASGAALVIPDRTTDLRDMPAVVCDSQYLQGDGMGNYACADAVEREYDPAFTASPAAGITIDQAAAIADALQPSGTNVFATIQNLVNIDLFKNEKAISSTPYQVIAADHQIYLKSTVEGASVINLYAADNGVYIRVKSHATQGYALVINAGTETIKWGMGNETSTLTIGNRFIYGEWVTLYKSGTRWYVVDALDKGLTYNELLTTDQIAAITGAASPSDANVFATMADVPDLASPGPIGNTTPDTGRFTNVLVKSITTPDSVLPETTAADITINPGDGDPVNGQGGNIILKPGSGNSLGGVRLVNIFDDFYIQLDSSVTDNRWLTIPDLSGTFGVITGGIAANQLIKSGVGLSDLIGATAGTDYQLPIEKGNNNIAVGSGAGASLTAFAQHNILMGVNAGQSLASGKWNFFAGQNAGQANINGEFGVCIGINSCSSLTGGGSPVFIGAETGKLTTTGDYDVFVGYDTGAGNIDGVANTVIGSSMIHAEHSSYNTIIGHNNAQNLIDGTGHNIIIGHGINTPATNTANYLNIGNAIIGDLSTGNVTITGTLASDNLSGTNTGDQDLSGLVPNTRTVAGHALNADVTITAGDVGAAATSHAHAPADVTGTAVITSDSRLSDARTPTAHNQDATTITTGVLAPDRLATGTGSQVLRRNAGNTALEFATLAGGGDVVGPASAVDSNFAGFDTTTGKLIKDSGSKASDFVSAANAKGYALPVYFSTSSTTDGATYYFAQYPTTLTTNATTFYLYIRKAGTVKIADVMTWNTAGGSAEDISMYIRLNNTTDTLIQTVGVAAASRNFTNSSLNISVAAGDFLNIKIVCPTWATNPTGWYGAGYIYIE